MSTQRSPFRSGLAPKKTAVRMAMADCFTECISPGEIGEMRRAAAIGAIVSQNPDQTNLDENVVFLPPDELVDIIDGEQEITERRTLGLPTPPADTLDTQSSSGEWHYGIRQLEERRLLYL